MKHQWTTVDYYIGLVLGGGGIHLLELDFAPTIGLVLIWVPLWMRIGREWK